MTDADYSEILEQISEQVDRLPPVWKDSIKESVSTRKKWLSIIKEYPELKSRLGRRRAVKVLSDKYNYSVSTIEAVLRYKNPFIQK